MRAGKLKWNDGTDAFSDESYKNGISRPSAFSSDDCLIVHGNTERSVGSSLNKEWGDYPCRNKFAAVICQLHINVHSGAATTSTASPSTTTIATPSSSATILPSMSTTLSKYLNNTICRINHPLKCGVLYIIVVTLYYLFNSRCEYAFNYKPNK